MNQQIGLKLKAWGERLMRRTHPQLHTLPPSIPPELALCIMDELVQIDRVKVGQGGEIQHALYDGKGLLNMSMKEMTVLYRAAPLLIERELDFCTSIGWTRSLIVTRLFKRPVSSDNILFSALLTKGFGFLELHDGLYGHDQRFRIRVDLRWTLYTQCRESSITCRGREVPVQNFASQTECSEIGCLCKSAESVLLNYIPEVLQELSEIWRLPSGNIDLEILIKHRLSEEDVFRQRTISTTKHILNVLSAMSLLAPLIRADPMHDMSSNSPNYWFGALRRVVEAHPFTFIFWSMSLCRTFLRNRNLAPQWRPRVPSIFRAVTSTVGAAIDKVATAITSILDDVRDLATAW
ncbi:hypothetical protein BST61_g2934 [Cercospora zeina]